MVLNNVVNRSKANINREIENGAINIAKYYLNRYKNSIGVELVFENYTSNQSRVLEWIDKYDNNFEHHVENVCLINKINDNYYDNISLSTGTPFIIKLSNKTYAIVRSNKIDTNNNYNNTSNRAIYIYIFGKDTYKFVKELKDMTNKPRTLSFYSVKSPTNRDFYVTAKDIINRDISTLYFDNDIINKLTNHIDKWIKNKHIYKERNLTYKTGILLFGEPGCGKSSLISAIGSKYGYSIINMDMGENFNNLDIDAFAQCINNDNLTYVICLEELDRVFEDVAINNNESESSDTNDKEEYGYNSYNKPPKQLTKGEKIQKLLLLLDSNSSPSNVVFIATTNHPEIIMEMSDKALIRKGRFDIIESITSLHKKDVAIKMCESFGLNKEKTNKVINKYDFNKGVKQSDLQYDILDNMEDM